MSDLDRALAAADDSLEKSLERLFGLLRIPSISTDPAYRNGCRETADWLKRELATLGFDAALRETPGHPVVLAKQPKADAPHVLFYGHYDVQPVDPIEKWETPPFEPRIATTKDGKKIIVARGSSDDKGQVMTFVEACRAWKAATGELPVGITILLEGEEECGSINLPGFLDEAKDELAADVALVCDTTMWGEGAPAITSSLRGLVYEEITVRAADRDLHSGMYGGAARNPLHVLSKIVADLHDADGRVTLPGFYDGVPAVPDALREEWRALGLDAAKFLGPIGLSIPAGESDRMVIEQIQSRPTCDVNGMWGGYTGAGAKTVIASEAHAKVSFRLVGDQDPSKVKQAFRAFVRERLPADCSVEFEGHKGSKAIQLPFDSPSLAKARAALADEWGVAPVTIGSGGSIPVVGDFKRTLGLDTLLIGFALDNDRIHSPNEKYDLESFRKGVRSWVRILAALAG
ncbi:M20/M25/M40 family metallo-hydrolase [Methylopila sp. Yamaguchi]|uniref:M20/M25/M40 family metallo-hydrolase n=1 Tax=Methylopila sp. Yamaguchi TaxID=1437817 RepID=UPI000CB35D8C|nr:M20/M25/M40 family metallo-hydrolase [Methylopila sp. Yamaguchi]GBD49122.1 peptidase M20 [Methylopila sp. Yamaguchi]